MTICRTCPRACRLAEGQVGACHARVNHGGKVVSENYGRLTSIALDPIEKKPIARWEPGTMVLSVGSYGCNLTCPFCQNHAIAQVSAREVPWREVAPRELVALALDTQRRDPRCRGISYTYNEPLVSWEYVRDCARLAHDAGLANVLVSNGCAAPEVTTNLAPWIDAANIDLKGFSAGFYEMCAPGMGAKALEAVKQTIATLAATRTCHLEVTTLVVPGTNDTPEDIAAIAAWLASLDADITYHVTRFFPRWHMQDREPTPVRTVYQLANVAREHLPHVLVGNC